MTCLTRTWLHVIATAALFLPATALLSADELSLVETKLLASDGHAGDGFGFAVAISGETAVVGADYDTPNGYNSGSAYVFVRSNGAWVEEAKLIPKDGGAHHAFGWAVDIEGNTAVIGARGDGENGPYSGSVYVFERNSGAWSQQAKLTSSDGEPFDAFGFSLALAGDTLIVGAPYDDHSGEFNPGSAYVFTRQGVAWSEQAKLQARDPGSEDFFGAFTAVDGPTAAIGASFDDDNGQDSGSVYVFERDGAIWTEQAKLLASDGSAGDSFGSLDLFADVILVGAEQDDDNGLESGSAYIFRRDGDNWTEEQKLVAADGEAGDHYGFAVGLERNRALIGAWGDDDNGAESGSAYLYERLSGEWIENDKLLASGGEPGDTFGWWVSLSGDRFVLGAYGDDENGAGAGAAYVFEPKLQLAVAGTCPGPVTLTISGAPPSSEVGVLAAANNNGWRKGGGRCAGTWLEIGEPFQLPPVWIPTDASGNGSASTTLDPDHCWLEAISLLTCETSPAVEVP